LGKGLRNGAAGRDCGNKEKEGIEGAPRRELAQFVAGKKDLSSLQAGESWGGNKRSGHYGTKWIRGGCDSRGRRPHSGRKERRRVRRWRRKRPKKTYALSRGRH